MKTTEGGFFAVAKYSIVAMNVATAEAYALLRGCEMVSSLGLHRLFLSLTPWNLFRVYLVRWRMVAGRFFRSW